MRSFHLIIFLLFSSVSAQAVEDKTRMLASIDQTFGNGIVEIGKVAVLEALVTLKMPFVLDVISSDSFTMGANGPANAPFDSSRGLSILIEQNQSVDHVSCTNQTTAQPRAMIKAPLSVIQP